MKFKKSPGYILFLIINYGVLFFLAATCFFPILHVLALSMSSSAAASSGRVLILPVEFNLQSYRYVVENNAFLKAFAVSVKRVALGVPINMFLTVLSAYPLSRRKEQFRMKTFFTWFSCLQSCLAGE